jgi:hypothetical protein
MIVTKVETREVMIRGILVGRADAQDFEETNLCRGVLPEEVRLQDWMSDSSRLPRETAPQPWKDLPHVTLPCFRAGDNVCSCLSYVTSRSR